ncbi:hypothetical protein FHT44_005003 [Mycolicibacterium sp. BK634]|uniref:hypothetical protein n=1 Tax=Mycolicibacterium sp. BK634 TaxID=2587099 RepID=UPI00160E8F27|nr:hypothetical protein [Mycolicibacterium sp. BK634]MBB3752491.1 hypothetical protein [Mycolicibacterium sp. BK634]
MSWHVGVYENTLTMDAAVAERLIAEGDNQGYLLFYENDKLTIDGDPAEHIDFFWQDWAEEILDDSSVNGVFAFISAEGDNAGSIWGYQFDQGRVTELVGEIRLVPAS